MYSRITASKNGREAIRYADGKGPGQYGRNVLVTTINMIPNGKYTEQMALLWKKARVNHKVQVRRIIISFSKKELDPNNEEDVEIANIIVREFVKTYYPDRQAALFFQADGTGGCLHCHAIVNDISITDHKGCTRTQQYYKYVRNGIDIVAAKYLQLDDGGKLKSKQTHTERAKAEKAAQIMNEYPQLQGEELRKTLIEKKAYSYKEDMKERIHEAALKSFDLKSFFTELKARGIEAIKKISPKYGEHIVYDFTACPVGVKNTKARSYKLGYSYGPEALRLMWAESERRKQKNLREEVDEFTEWMNRRGKRCFCFDKCGHLISADFDLRDKLYEEYIQEKSINTAVARLEELPATVSDTSQKKTAEAARSKANRMVHFNKPSAEVFKKDITAVKKLLKDTDEVIRKLSEIQNTQKPDNTLGQQVAAEFNFKKQKEKSL